MFGMHSIPCTQSAGKTRLAEKCSGLVRAVMLGLVVAVAGIPAQAQVPATAPSAAAENASTALVPGKFVDTTAASGVNFQGVASHTSKKYLIETMGSGAAVLDYDNDGLLDIF